MSTNNLLAPALAKVSPPATATGAAPASNDGDPGAGIHSDAAGASVTEAEKRIMEFFLQHDCDFVEPQDMRRELRAYGEAYSRAAVEAATKEWKKAHEVLKEVAFAEQKECRDLRAQLAVKTAEVERLKFAAQWYPISDMLPSHGNEVLLIWSRENCDTFRTGRWVNSLNDFRGNGAVKFKTKPTHWVELPSRAALAQTEGKT